MGLWKKPWIWGPAGVAGFAALLANSNAILSNARSLPDEWDKTTNQFLSWYHDDDAWKGQWTTESEGFADASQMDLSKGKFLISVEDVKNGRFGGSMESQEICDHVPFFESLMIEGHVSGAKTAKVIVWDLLGGFRRNFATLRLNRDGDIMIVEPIDDPAGVFQKQYRVARSPTDFQSELEKAGFCEGKVGRTVKAMSTHKAGDTREAR